MKTKTTYKMTTDYAKLTKIAEKLVEISQPDFNNESAAWYLDLITFNLFEKRKGSHTNPWSSDAVIIPIEACVSLPKANFNYTIDWDRAATSLKNYPEIQYYFTFEDPFATAESDADYIQFILENGEKIEYLQGYLEEIYAHEQQAYEEAVSFTIGEILTEIEV